MKAGGNTLLDEIFLEENGKKSKKRQKKSWLLGRFVTKLVKNNIAVNLRWKLFFFFRERFLLKHDDGFTRHRVPQNPACSLWFPIASHAGKTFYSV